MASGVSSITTTVVVSFRGGAPDPRPRLETELRPVAGDRPLAVGRELARLDDGPRFVGRVHVRRDHAHRAGVEDAIGVVAVMARDAHDRA
jgi:hypothetical protein